MKRSLYLGAVMLAVAAAAIIPALDRHVRASPGTEDQMICPDGTTNCTSPNGPDVTGLRDGLQRGAEDQMICPDGTTDCTNPNGPDVTGLRDGLQHAAEDQLICPDGTTDCTSPNGPEVTGLRDSLQASIR